MPFFANYYLFHFGYFFSFFTEIINVIAKKMYGEILGGKMIF